MDGLAARMPAALYREWVRFHELEPWGAADAWNRAGTICATVANFAAGRKRDSPVLTAKEFTPQFGLRRPASLEPRWKQEQAQVLAWAARAQASGG